MRKSALIGVGTVSAAVIAFGGIASASSSHRSSDDSAQRAAASTASSTASSTRVSAAQAEAIAVARMPGSRVVEINLETNNGQQVWNVHLATPTGDVEVKVDALTGAVRLDDDNAPNDEANEDRGAGADDGQVDDRGSAGQGADDTQVDDNGHGGGGDDASGHH